MINRVSGNDVWEDILAHKKIEGDIVTNKKTNKEYKIVNIIPGCCITVYVLQGVQTIDSGKHLADVVVDSKTFFDEYV